MSILPYLLCAFVFGCGLFGIVTSRNVIHMVVCVSVCQSATYILLLAIGYKNHGTAPVYADIPSSRVVTDPIVQSLTLTDIVVAVAVSAVLLAFALKAYEHHGSLDPAEMTGLKG
ncbi:MAG TPA: NADH-quinone oxidoreductase subunit K [Gaiellaceae bacterium]|nr:NADH-quinone oxidoreductase subunit K [Gaiellaceae bacterium]